MHSMTFWLTKHTLRPLVHLDASEMLKYFTKDGKPMKKELKSLLNQVYTKTWCLNASLNVISLNTSYSLFPLRLKKNEKYHQVEGQVKIFKH